VTAAYGIAGYITHDELKIYVRKVILPKIPGYVLQVDGCGPGRSCLQAEKHQPVPPHPANAMLRKRRKPVSELHQHSVGNLVTSRNTGSCYVLEPSILN
jgi:hypothetical protein